MARTNLVLKKVLSKLYRLHLDGANFEMSRWLFDWDSSISPAENIGINQELSALQRLENQRCIALRVEENPDYAIPDRMLGSPDFSDYVFCRDVSGQKIYKKFRDISDYMLSQQLSVAPESDSAWEYSNWAVWITSFDYEKFVALCSSIGFDPASAGSPAELSFTSISTPTISMDGTEYTLNPLSEGGKPFNIISYCLTTKPGQLVRLGELRRQSGLATVTNINQALKRSYFDRNNGLLRYFVRATSGSIKVTPGITLSDYAKQQLIENARQS